MKHAKMKQIISNLKYSACLMSDDEVNQLIRNINGLWDLKFNLKV